jgi:Uncharacterised nucleotidyltransferase
MSSVALPQRAPATNPASARGSPELQLVLSCSRFQTAEECGSRIQESLKKGLQWDKVLTLATNHGLIPQLYQSVWPYSSALPGDFLAALHSSFERNARQTLFLTQLLANVWDAFHRKGIEALPLKGPVLAQTLYGNVALRQFSDVDLLLRPRDVKRAKLALKELGFSPNIELTTREEAAHIASGYEYVFDGAGYKSLIEVQWRILPPFYAVDFDTNGFFDRAGKIDICARQVHAISPNDLVLILCVHAAKHLWQKISWIRDIADLADSLSIDWNTVIESAGNLGIHRLVGITFFLAQELLSSPMPSPVQRLWEQDQPGRALGTEILDGILQCQEINTVSPRYFRLMLRLRERPFDRVRFLWRLGVTPTISEWRSIRLPAPLFPAYCLVRAARLLSRAFQKLSGM